MEDKLNVILAKLEKIDQRFDEQEKRFDEQDKKSNARFDEQDKKFNARFDEQDKKFTVRFDEINARLDKHDKAFAKQESKFDRIDNRLSNLETGQGEIKDIVKRIEVNQNKDVIALLKTFNTKIDSHSEVLNKRLFQAETDINKLSRK
ncbi:hypothetical protein ACOJQI_21515 [Bacillus salacetis]|uniref:hypothetical protein n=1 Tax=Bacillus salacetis TaxID=2315464 RepID=UPI003BA06E7D